MLSVNERRRSATSNLDVHLRQPLTDIGKSNLKAIPKKLHIIWIGNDIPQRNRDCIATFPTKNPDWEVNLWIDAKQLLTGERRRAATTHYTAQNNNGSGVSVDQWKTVAERVGKDGDDRATMKYLEQYLNYRGEALQGMRVQKINSIMAFCKSNRIKLREVERDLNMGKTAPIYRQELVERGGNFGAASDILRIEILMQYGGVYVDTDVSCASPLGSIICHESYPRFSAVNHAWKDGVSQSDWESAAWWETKVGSQTPAISNSVIACHPRSKGMKTYKAMVRSNFKTLKNDAARRELYFNDVRKSTIQMTGPTAASKGSGFTSVKEKLERSVGGITTEADLTARQLSDKLFMRDNWYFPMYMIVDRYFHDWL
ncbi:Subversion of eukaryotic traffic protein A [Caballeronia sordidicola]|uniref:Subversion of eukaryotic traffic protein A n=1 Tax=Caballeronia sordidicola TaxID=196367 RepID=A0A158HBN6_CABSO|nr:Subversion of eukaryotic traffic protein A [Caballeronia sordidicola]